MISFQNNRQIVAVSWDHHELVCLVATRMSQQFRLDEAFRVDLGLDQPFPSACEELTNKLKSLSVQKYDLLIALPRTQVNMLEVELPPASMNELPLMVRNEVMRQDGEISENALVDYHLIDEQPGQPLRIEAAAVRPDTEQMVDTLTTALGVKASQIVVRFQAIASLFKRQVKKLPESSLLLNLMQSAADVSVLDQQQITFTRSIHLSAEDTPEVDAVHLADEIRRTIFVAPNQKETQVEIRHVYMFADLQVDDSLVAQLADELQMTVSLLDPLANVVLMGVRPPEVHRLAALVGMIWDFIDGSTPLDFANPKQPPARPKLGRKIGFYATLAGIAVITIGWMLRSEVDQSQQQLGDLTAEAKATQQILDRLQKKTRVMDAVQRWQQNQTNWLDELQRLSEKLPPREQATIKRLNMLPSSNLGMLTMSVEVSDPAVIANLEHELRDGRHQVSSQRISPAGSGEQSSFRFETRVKVLPGTVKSATKSNQ